MKILSYFWRKKVPVTEKKVHSELFETYIEVTPNTPMCDLIAIQDWVKEQPELTLESMPVADISGSANRNGACYVVIDALGYVNYGKTHPSEFRKITHYIYPKVTGYAIADAEVHVLGKRYNKQELEAALANLETR